ncbi:hypothetical protein ABPG72_010133 [Tetrahymena utriculariae]
MNYKSEVPQEKKVNSIIKEEIEFQENLKSDDNFQTQVMKDILKVVLDQLKSNNKIIINPIDKNHQNILQKILDQAPFTNPSDNFCFSISEKSNQKLVSFIQEHQISLFQQQQKGEYKSIMEEMVMLKQLRECLHDEQLIKSLFDKSKMASNFEQQKNYSFSIFKEAFKKRNIISSQNISEIQKIIENLQTIDQYKDKVFEKEQFFSSKELFKQELIDVCQGICQKIIKDFPQNLESVKIYLEKLRDFQNKISLIQKMYDQILDEIITTNQEIQDRLKTSIFKILEKIKQLKDDPNTNIRLSIESTTDFEIKMLKIQSQNLKYTEYISGCIENYKEALQLLNDFVSQTLSDLQQGLKEDSLNQPKFKNIFKILTKIIELDDLKQGFIFEKYRQIKDIQKKIKKQAKQAKNILKYYLEEIKEQEFDTNTDVENVNYNQFSEFMKHSKIIQIEYQEIQNIVSDYSFQNLGKLIRKVYEQIAFDYIQKIQLLENIIEVQSKYQQMYKLVNNFSEFDSLISDFRKLATPDEIVLITFKNLQKSIKNGEFESIDQEIELLINQKAKIQKKILANYQKRLVMKLKSYTLPCIQNKLLNTSFKIELKALKEFIKKEENIGTSLQNNYQNRLERIEEQIVEYQSSKFFDIQKILDDGQIQKASSQLYQLKESDIQSFNKFLQKFQNKIDEKINLFKDQIPQIQISNFKNDLRLVLNYMKIIDGILKEGENQNYSKINQLASYIFNKPQKLFEECNQILDSSELCFIKCNLENLFKYQHFYNIFEDIFEEYLGQTQQFQNQKKTMPSILNKLYQEVEQLYSAQQFLINKIQVDRNLRISWKKYESLLQLLNSNQNELTIKLNLEIIKTLCEIKNIEQISENLIGLQKISKNVREDSIYTLGSLLKEVASGAEIINKIPSFQLYRTQKFNELVENKLIEILTGEGKSLTLAFSSIMLALLGCEVDAICYSSYLSQRDYKDFKDIFKNFGVSEKISYGSFQQQAEKYLNKYQNIRNLTLNLIQQTNQITKDSSTTCNGYFSLFAYFYENSLGNIDNKSLQSNINLKLSCGNISYALLPGSYTSILGVTGTLQP